MSFQLLIVDDEVPIRKALASYIPWEEYNCTVYDTASNGKEAIKKLEAHPVDLVITDVKMPLMTIIQILWLLFCPAMRNLNMPSLQCVIMYLNIC